MSPNIGIHLPHLDRAVDVTQLNKYLFPHSLDDCLVIGTKLNSIQFNSTPCQISTSLTAQPDRHLFSTSSLVWSHPKHRIQTQPHTPLPTWALIAFNDMMWRYLHHPLLLGRQRSPLKTRL